jgi:hypothetical protein
MGRVARVESYTKPLLLWVQIWQNLARGGATNGQIRIKRKATIKII